MPLEVAEHQREHKGDLGPRKYSREYIQRFIDTARASGYLVTYNHPCWSMEAEEDTLSYDGCFSLEVFNTGSEKISGYECNMALYDKFLRKGKFLYVHGADDNHNKAPFGDLMCDSFGSWTQILAEELTYPAVIRALEEGRFYATTGPEITGVTMHSVPGWVGDDHCITAEIEGVKAVVDICSSTSAIAGWSAVALLRNLASPVCFY